jgi:dUTP pyrophosphatase
MNEAIVKFKKLNKDAKDLTIAYKGDACSDIYSIEEKIIAARGFEEVNIGMAFELPEGWEMQIRTRSSFGRKGLQCHMGTVDEGYRGYISVFIYNHTDRDYKIGKGDKIAQVAIRPVPKIIFQEVQELIPSERGEKGFGSSGK